MLTILTRFLSSLTVVNMRQGTIALLDRTDIQEKLLEELRAHGQLGEAARAINTDRTNVWRYCQRNPEFAVRYREALEEGAANLPSVLRQTLIDRAIQGELIPVYRAAWLPEPEAKTVEEAHERAMRGPNVIGYRRMPASDKLLSEAVKAHCPEFRDKPGAITVNVPGGSLDELVALIVKEAKKAGLHGPSVTPDTIRKRLARIASSDFNGLDSLTESEAVS